MERTLYRWAWLAIALGAVVAAGVITCRSFRYRYVKFDQTGDQLTSVLYDRWLHRTCAIVLNSAQNVTFSRCWDGDHTSFVPSVHPVPKPVPKPK
jgi:hypothetical protein